MIIYIYKCKKNAICFREQFEKEFCHFCKFLKVIEYKL